MTAVGGTREYAYTYEPFGAGPDPAPLTAGAPANPLRFTGEYRDPRTALYNFRTRQYAPATGRFTSVDPVAAPLTDPAVGPYVYVSDRATVWTDPTGEFPCPFGRNPDGGCRGGDAARTAGEAARGAGAAARDFALGLAAPAPVRGQRIIDGAKASLADCYTGLTTAVNPAAGCVANISGLTQVMQGLALAFDGCVYVGAYQATGGAIQLFLTLAPIGRGLGSRTTTRAGPDLPYPSIPSSIGGFSVEQLSAAARVLDRNELTRAGRALQKHGDRAGSAFPRSTGDAAARNAQGQAVVDAILRDPRRRVEVLDRVIHVWDSRGRGVRFNRAGSFVGFLEPRR